MKNWSIILLAVLCFSLISFDVNSYEGSHKRFSEMPVMRLHVYMMGRESVDPALTTQIFQNVEYLNEVFKGEIQFSLEELFMDPNHAFLPDLYKSFQAHEREIVEPIVEPIEKKGAINIYLFDTYAEPGHDAALMGFTPLLSARQETYAVNSPRFDRILMAYDGLNDNKTLVHEMGHFFGLKHPWELTDIAKFRLGIRTHTDEVHNHMSYGSEVEKFTTQQLVDMKRYAMRYRTYLMDRVVRTYAGI